MKSCRKYDFIWNHIERSWFCLWDLFSFAAARYNLREESMVPVYMLMEEITSWDISNSSNHGIFSHINHLALYLQRIFSHVDVSPLPPTKSQTNSGQACESMVQEVKLLAWKKWLQNLDFIKDVYLFFGFVSALILFVFSHMVYSNSIWVYRHIPATFHLFDVFISSNLLLFERVLAYLAGYFLRGIHYEFIYCITIW